MWHAIIVALVQSLSCVWLFMTPWTAACQASLSLTISHSLPKFMTIESVMLSYHVTLCCPVLLLPSIFPSPRVFSNESAVSINGQSIGTSASESMLLVTVQRWFPLGLTGLISLLSKGLSSGLQHHNSKASILRSSALFLVQLTFILDYWKDHSFDCTDLCQQSDIFAF